MKVKSQLVERVYKALEMKPAMCSRARSGVSNRQSALAA